MSETLPSPGTFLLPAHPFCLEAAPPGQEGTSLKSFLQLSQRLAQRGAMGAQKGCQGMGDGQRLQSPGGTEARTSPTPPLQDPETPAFLSTFKEGAKV